MKKSFLFVVVDRDKNLFTINGPMHDDTLEMGRIQEAQVTGRNVNGFAVEATPAARDRVLAEQQRDGVQHSMAPLV